ncbi:hypothetical protein CTZ27_31195 [Streptomyces griseocarneus]|nr:hypothetical protein CTZ27_31195 [Streptomyces griseocarneus]
MTALMAATRVAKQTVYNDLHSQGIDPSTDRPKGAAMLTPVTVNGMTGVEEEDAKNGLSMDALGALAAEIAKQRDVTVKETSADVIPVFQQRLLDHMTAEGHRETVPAANAELEARMAKDQAVGLMERAWEALGKPATNEWVSAHHRYQEAADKALAAAQVWQLAAEALQQAIAKNFDEPTVRTHYLAMVPKEQQIEFEVPDAQAVIHRLREQHERRTQIAAVTLRGLGAAGSGE